MFILIFYLLTYKEFIIKKFFILYKYINKIESHVGASPLTLLALLLLALPLLLTLQKLVVLDPLGERSHQLSDTLEEFHVFL